MRKTVSVRNLQDKCDRPKKQGVLYSIQLGKTNGPYLVKDIMLNNPKSIRLLVGNQIMSSHMSMIRSLQKAQSYSKNGTQIFDQKTNSVVRYDQRFKSGLALSNNFFLLLTNVQSQLHILTKNMNNLKSIRLGYKSELTKLQIEINQHNQQNTNTILPMLKQFYSNIKQTFFGQKNQSYLFYRQIDQLKRQKSGLLQQILFCQKKIIVLQKQLGINYRKVILDQDQLSLEIPSDKTTK